MTELVLAPWRRDRTQTLRLYVGFVRLAFLKFLAYRLRYYTGVVSYTVFVAGNAYLYRALYASRPEAAGVEIDVAAFGPTSYQLFSSLLDGSDSPNVPSLIATPASMEDRP
mgnify:CR=1 FL=1